MPEPTPSRRAQAEDVGRQLETTAGDLRALAEQVGAIPPGTAPRTISPRRAQVTFAAVVTLAALAGWFVWEHWHSLLAATAPLIWVAAHGWRLRRRVASPEEATATGSASGRSADPRETEVDAV